MAINVHVKFFLQNGNVCNAYFDQKKGFQPKEVRCGVIGRTQRCAGKGVALVALR